LEIDLDRLAENLRVIREAAQVPVIGVVKANAYGHGALPVARELVRQGVLALAVATVEEGKRLRRGGIEGPILLLGSLHPAQVREVLEARLIPSLSTWEAATALEAAARALGLQAPVHLEFDTGMHRVGFPWREASALRESLARLERLKVEGIYSHLASADEDEAQTRSQIARFQEIRSAWKEGYLYHLANSAGSLLYPEARFGAVRVGLALYGLFPHPSLHPIARLLAHPTLVKRVGPGEPIGYGGTYRPEREEWIATLPAGYADGLPRALGNQGAVRGPEGELCPIVGRVSMDQITVRISKPVGLEATFELVSADFDPLTSLSGWAARTGTIAYEMAVRLSPRLPRRYWRQGAVVDQEEP